MIACNETAYWTRLNKSLTFGENSMELTERESYQSRSGDYTYGASVLAALDAKLREETNGERSLEDVLSQLNQQEQVTHASFRDTVVDVGGQQMGPWVDRYVAGVQCHLRRLQRSGTADGTYSRKHRTGRHLV